ncbi:MAG: flagellin [Planctomycetota bacterium]
MTRINTNVISLSAQNTLAKSNNQLTETLTRLSTGLRINTGKDDPAGLIASTALGNDIKSTQQAIANSQVANQMISTADSALGQINTLLTSVRGLVTQAANTGAMSSAQIAANQLQIDSSLDAINRISQTTKFQGQNLLDGSLGFLTAGTSSNYAATVKDLQVNQVNMGTASQVAVDVKVTTAATQATITTTMPGGAAASARLSFTGDDPTNASPVYKGLTITAPDSSSQYANTSIEIVQSSTVAAGSPTASYAPTKNVLTITVNDTSATTAAAIATAITTSTDFKVNSTTKGGSYTPMTDMPSSNAADTITTADGGKLQISATSLNSTWNGKKVAFLTTGTSSTPSVAYDSGTSTLTITTSSSTPTSLQSVANAINNSTDAGVLQFSANVEKAGSVSPILDGAATVPGTAANSGFITLNNGVTMKLTATNAGSAGNNLSINVVESTLDTAGLGAKAKAVYDSSYNQSGASGKLTLTLARGATITTAELTTAIEAAKDPLGGDVSTAFNNKYTVSYNNAGSVIMSDMAPTPIGTLAGNLAARTLTVAGGVDDVTATAASANFTGAIAGQHVNVALTASATGAAGNGLVIQLKEGTNSLGATTFGGTLGTAGDPIIVTLANGETAATLQTNLNAYLAGKSLAYTAVVTIPDGTGAAGALAVTDNGDTPATQAAGSVGFQQSGGGGNTLTVSLTANAGGTAGNGVIVNIVGSDAAVASSAKLNKSGGIYTVVLTLAHDATAVDANDLLQAMNNISAGTGLAGGDLVAFKAAYTADISGVFSVDTTGYTAADTNIATFTTAGGLGAVTATAITVAQGTTAGGLDVAGTAATGTLSLKDNTGAPTQQLNVTVTANSDKTASALKVIFAEATDPTVTTNTAVYTAPGGVKTLTVTLGVGQTITATALQTLMNAGLEAGGFGSTNVATGYTAAVTDALANEFTTAGAGASFSATGSTTGGINPVNGLSGALSGAGVGATLANASAGTLSGDLVVQLGGNAGSQVFTFASGTTADQMKTAINQASDATGVGAALNSTTGMLELNSTDYGTSQFVNVNVVKDSGTFSANLGATHAAGTDIAATVNNIKATGSGNTVSINTPSLAFNATLADGAAAGTDVSFNINGGGALFQLGAQVVSSQQARLGIQSVDSANLGGISGRLYELGSGKDAALATSTRLAAKIVTAAADQVSAIRGRLGAFQKATVDTNISSLTDAVTNLTAAQSSIQDADFAAESSNLTRAQILVQSGTSVLGIANKNPENVLSLLR